MNRLAPYIQRGGAGTVLSVCLWVFLFCSPAAVRAEEAVIRDFTVTNAAGDLLLYLAVENCFTDQMEDGIHNGIPATFTFLAELYRKRKAWPDRKVGSRTLTHTLTYDSLKEEYRLVMSERSETLVTDSLTRAKTVMAEINGFHFIPLDRLETGQRYQLRVKAKLARKTLPLYVHYLIPFSSLWDFETEWYELEFTF